MLPGDKLPRTPNADYDHAWQRFVHGDLVGCQREAEQGSKRFQGDKSEWAPQFQVLAAEAMVWRGKYDEALNLLNNFNSPALHPQGEVEKLALEAVAFTRKQELTHADEILIQAESVCQRTAYPACGDVFGARGILDVAQGKIPAAQKSFSNALVFAHAHQNLFLETYEQSNLGWTALQIEHFDEAMDWLSSAYRNCMALGAEEICEKVTGNLGWAYFKLGDGQRALDLFLEAEKSAARLGSIRAQLGWITTAGYVYRESGDVPRALNSYRRALALAREIKSTEDTVNSLEDLAHASIDLGNTQEAETYLDEASHLIRASGSRIDELDIMLARARIAMFQHRPQQAESLLNTVDHDSASQTSMRIGAEHGLAQLYESENRSTAADGMYRTALTTFDSARDRLKNEDSKLPFLANATSIYDDYIHFLIAQGKPELALRIADQSRGQTLAQGLGLTTRTSFTAATDLRPADIARERRSDLLFYWLGEKQSYLWAITPNQTSLYTLPPKREIATVVGRYRSALLGIGDPVENSNPDGLALYRMLVAPASKALIPTANTIILSDGALSMLNFETLIVPTPTPHYWIEDTTVASASSLHLLASANTNSSTRHKLLLVGDAISPNPDYPELPMASSEMTAIQQHFLSQNEVVYSRERATAAAYFAASPRQFSYIHFVAHGVASRTDPLDSAIILSRSTAAEDSFKLHARDIIQHPIHADLVTVSACYGSGARSYAGEGSIGLAWAFLRAGAHNAIGALWEVSDQSSPQLMGALYEGLQNGESPTIALHQAKLTLLHSRKEFRKPFYWAPFQIYTGL